MIWEKWCEGDTWNALEIVGPDVGVSVIKFMWMVEAKIHWIVEMSIYIGRGEWGGEVWEGYFEFIV